MKLYPLILSLLLTAGLAGQNTFFEAYTPKQSDATGYIQRYQPDKASSYFVNSPAALATALRKAPNEGSGEPSYQLSLPTPEGELVTFRIVRYQMITDELQARYPSYVTAYGWDVKAPHRKVFLEWTDLGFGASVTGGAEGRWNIAPQFRERQDLYQSFFTKDHAHLDGGSTCHHLPDPELLEEIEALGPPALKTVGDCELREYDLALACTGEYFAATGGAENLVVAEMMTAINRVNTIFRSDLAITLTIINLPVPGGGIELVFDNPVTDGYTNDDGAAMLSENQAIIDNVIGPGNYDVGHVFSTGGGGIAALNSVCRGLSKAQGVTGSFNPSGDPFYVDLVAHEFGHQFGAQHSFNSTIGSCDQRNASTAYEPGSGTTIMAYAGICFNGNDGSANIQFNSDPYYHAISIQEIAAYMENGTGASCASTASTANDEPTVNAGSDFTIPANTPFVLTATGSDSDPLTYCWEQFDLGPAVPAQPSGNETSGPLFRSRPPTTSPQRFFPNLPDLVNNGFASWEILPRVARNLSFVVSVRDFNAAGYGCTVQDQVDLSVVTSTGFAVTAPTAGTVWQSGGNQTVSWNVANTGNGTAVDCEQVDIVLSTDGGLNFDQVIATVPNTGSATIMAPSQTVPNARLMIRCSDNIFFNINNGGFSIEQNDYSYVVTNGAATACDGTTTVQYSFQLNSLQGYTGTINYTTANLPAGVGTSFSPSSTTLSANGTQAVTLTLSNLAGVTPGTYTFQVITNDGNGPRSEDYTLVVKAPLAAPVLISPADNGFTPANSASFSWNAVPNAVFYEFRLCLNAACTSFISGQTSGTSITTDLTTNGIMDGDGPFEWFITAVDNTCIPAASAASTRFNVTFGAGPPSGSSLAAGNSRILVCEGETTDESYSISFFDADLTGPATLNQINGPAGLSTVISPSTLSDGQTAMISLIGEENLAPGNYTITIQANDGMNTEDVDLILEVTENSIPLISPTEGQEIEIEPDGSGSVPLSFAGVPGATAYEVFIVFPGGVTGSTNVAPGNTTINLPATINDGDVYQIFVRADNGDEGCPVTFTFVDVVLPVSWQSFTAVAQDKSSQLDWSVIQDAAHQRFTVERSDSGTGGWADIASVERVGPDGLTNYAYQDREVVAGRTYFYRLRQEDNDGQTDYSAIRSVTFAGQAAITAYPNPTSDQLNLLVSTDLPAGLSYQLYSALGQQIARGKLVAGNNLLSVGVFPPAVYQLVVSDGKGFRQIIRVVKR